MTIKVFRICCVFGKEEAFRDTVEVNVCKFLQVNLQGFADQGWNIIAVTPIASLPPLDIANVFAVTCQK